MTGAFFPFLRFESRRLCHDRRNLLFVALLVSLSVYFIVSGIIEYQRFRQEEKNFREFESQKVNQYATYAQYAGYGFRLLYRPSPLVVFFANSNVLEDVSSNVDTSEIININHSFKGKSLFLNRGYFKDFAGVVFLFGCLFMLYMGMSALVSPAYLKFLSRSVSLPRLFFLTTCCRLLLLTFGFGLLLTASFLLPLLWGIRFSSAETLCYAGFGLTVLLFLAFCYLLGALLWPLFHFKRAAGIWMVACWFILAFLIPEVVRLNLFTQSRRLPANDQVNIEKLKLLMDFERRSVSQYQTVKSNTQDVQKLRNQVLSDYLNNVFLFIRNYEMRLHEETRRLIREYENNATICPPSLYYLVCAEISSKGYYGYLDFMEYIIRLRHDFLKYFLRKYYYENDPTVTSFVRNEENIFSARSHLPRPLALGLVLTFLYGLALYTVTLWLLKKRIFQP